MTSRALAAALLAVIALLLLLSACGSAGPGSSSPASDAAPTTVPGNADAADVAVIEGWSRALAHGDINGAADYFAIPSVAENGPLLVRIHNVDEARAFNASLPCGARVIRAQGVGRFTTVTFRLTDRKGPGGGCGPGVGGTAQTSFVIRNGKIAEWRRVGTGGPSQSPPAATA